MARSGGSSPTGLTQRQARTLFLKAPYSDWPAISQGRKTEFRAAVNKIIAANVLAPTPVVLYAQSPRLGKTYSQLAVLVEHRIERLMDIAELPDSLTREGFADYDSFRRYWRRRTGRPYRALDRVAVFRLAPWSTNERERLGALLLDRLYRDHYPGGQ